MFFLQMASFFSITFIILSITTSTLTKSQTIQSPRLLDLHLRDCSFKNFDIHVKTGSIQTIHLPSNFSGIRIDAVRFRCGSLQRYGAQMGEFHLGTGVSVQPCAERVMLVKQDLGSIWFPVYYKSYNLSGYQIVSPVLGLLAYNANPDGVSSNPYEINIISPDKNPILINFLNTTKTVHNNSSSSMLCAVFGTNGEVTFQKLFSPNVCAAKSLGHFCLVIKTEKQNEDPDGDEDEGPLIEKRKISSWKVAVGSVIGTAIAAFLLGLLLIAMLVNVKKKAVRDEMERRAYEEEAIQVSMVGHVTAPRSASGSRNMPRNHQHGFVHYPS